MNKLIDEFKNDNNTLKKKCQKASITSSEYIEKINSLYQENLALKKENKEMEKQLQEKIQDLFKTNPSLFQQSSVTNFDTWGENYNLEKRINSLKSYIDNNIFFDYKKDYPFLSDFIRLNVYERLVSLYNYAKNIFNDKNSKIERLQSEHQAKLNSIYFLKDKINKINLKSCN